MYLHICSTQVTHKSTVRKVYELEKIVHCTLTTVHRNNAVIS